MKIGVISDTHLHDCSPELERIHATYFKDVDMILHAGDVVEAGVLDAFLPKRIEAVAGNMDLPSARNQFPIKKTIGVDGFRIGLIHGWGRPDGIEERIRKEFTTIDCLVYGHTHRPANHVVNGVLFFNPGSLTEKHYTKANSLGILEITDEIRGTIINL
jgi:putative phosphoesterase